MCITQGLGRVCIALAAFGLLACEAADSSPADAMAADAEGEDVGADVAVDAEPDAGPAQPPSSPYADHPLLQPGPLVIAHRGGRRVGPECTLPTYEAAWAAGADVLEADVQMTADGVVVIMHDTTVDRTTDGTGPLNALTLDELRALDAGYTYGEEEGYPFRGTGRIVPTLDELLTALPDAPVTLEIKQDDPPMIDALLAVLDAHDARGRVVVAAYDDGTTAALREAAPDLLTAMAFGEVVSWITLPPGSDPGNWQPPGHFLQIPVAQAGFELVTAENLAHARLHGVRMHPYTINDPDEMRLLVEMGVDGIITDDPVTLRALIDAQGE